MVKFIVRRLALAVPILFGVSLISFFLMKLVPGDIAIALLGPYAIEEALASLRAQLGLDLPVYMQYLRWIQGYLHGDLGFCISYNVPVTTILGERAINSLILGSTAFAIAVVVGAGTGIIAGTKSFSLVDRASTLSVLFLISAPTFWLGLMLMYVFSPKLGWLPAQGIYSIGKEGNILNLLSHLVLPAIAATANSLATIFRLTRSEMMDTLGKSYILAARARGLRERLVIYKHALRNILPTVVNVSAMQIGFIFGGQVFAEVVFNWPGVGLLLYRAITTRDIAVIQAVLLLVGAIFVIANMFSDVVHALVDPRTRRD